MFTFILQKQVRNPDPAAWQRSLLSVGSNTDDLCHAYGMQKLGNLNPKRTGKIFPTTTNNCFREIFIHKKGLWEESLALQFSGFLFM